jgi:hypothetical protein
LTDFTNFRLVRLAGGRSLGQHDLLRVQTDAEKYLLLACLNLVECVAYVGAQLQYK